MRLLVGRFARQTPVFRRRASRSAWGPGIWLGTFDAVWCPVHAAPPAVRSVRHHRVSFTCMWSSQNDGVASSAEKVAKYGVGVYFMDAATAKKGRNNTSRVCGMLLSPREPFRPAFGTEGGGEGGFIGLLGSHRLLGSDSGAAPCSPPRSFPPVSVKNGLYPASCIFSRDQPSRLGITLRNS